MSRTRDKYVNFIMLNFCTFISLVFRYPMLTPDVPNTDHTHKQICGKMNTTPRWALSQCAGKLGVRSENEESRRETHL